VPAPKDVASGARLLQQGRTAVVVLTADHDGTHSAPSLRRADGTTSATIPWGGLDEQLCWTVRVTPPAGSGPSAEREATAGQAR